MTLHLGFVQVFPVELHSTFVIFAYFEKKISAESNIDQLILIKLTLSTFRQCRKDAVKRRTTSTSAFIVGFLYTTDQNAIQIYAYYKKRRGFPLLLMTSIIGNEI